MPHPRPRVTEEDYQDFLGGLCSMPPGPLREECMREMTGRLLTLYAEYRVNPPPGLQAFAVRIGVREAGGD